MSDYTLTIKSYEKKGVLDDITDVITSHGANISYVHLFVEKNNIGSINLELEHVEDIDELLSDLNDIDEVKSVELHGSQLDIYGKRIIIVGGEHRCPRWLWEQSLKQIDIIYVENV